VAPFAQTHGVGDTRPQLIDGVVPKCRRTEDAEMLLVGKDIRCSSYDTVVYVNLS
jgi:hypothetical protein